MKALHWFTGGILLAALVGCSAYMLASTFGYAHPWLEIFLVTEAGRRSAGGIILAVLVLYGLSAVPSGKQERFISFENEWGVVNVSIEAVTDFISRLSSEFASVVSLSAGVSSSAGNNGIDIAIDMRVKSGTNIPELCKILQERIKASVSESIGVADVRSVMVNVKEIVSSQNSANNGGDDRADV